jgi:hypothetical protein
LDYYAYLDLAKELAAPDEELDGHAKEARQRSAVSRAYYALFLTTRDAFDPEYKYRPPAEGNSHIKLWKQLKCDLDADIRDIGRLGSDLGAARVAADYGEFILDLHKFVADALDNAEELKLALSRVGV